VNFLSEKQTDLIGKVYKLKDLIEYQVGSVVSRTIIDKDVGTVTLFAFDEGEGLSEHMTPYDALVIDLDGEVEIKIAGNKNHLTEGDAVIMPANKPHALRALTKFKMMLVMIKAE
jgi:quercetin dioxygenase-like cupin family protein